MSMTRLHRSKRIASGKEKEGFITPMSQQMKNRNRKCTQATGHNHETDLTDCGIGQNLFNIRLGQGHNTSKYRGCGSDNCDECHGKGGQDNQRTQSYQ